VVSIQASRKARGLAEKEKVFFFEKKKQKTFICAVADWPAAHAKEQKFFGSFFQKRTLPSILSAK
jgi:hypothetical protein